MAFTEQGVAIISSVLNSERAILVFKNIKICSVNVAVSKYKSKKGMRKLMAKWKNRTDVPVIPLRLIGVIYVPSWK